MDEADAQKGEIDLDLDLAGAGSRLASYLIDAIVLNIIYIALLIVFRVPTEKEVIYGDGFTTTLYTVYILIAVAGIGYFTYFFGKGQTPGMKLVEIKLIRADGIHPIGYKKGFFRWVGMEISGMVFLLGYIWILIDKKKQGWHDKIAGTYVVRA
ncbi:MAG TPA: RDD family protein [Methanotrichaceae archaeon]|nr:RDD family protein [Methanotrichaceae archaeon]